jgi:site-specific recombinase XerD
VNSIALFATFLVYYDPLQRLDEATSGDVWMFLANWFPRKALWASETSVRAYLTSFRKFFQWMGDTGHVSPETTTNVLTMLKAERGAFLEAVRES